MRISLAEAEQVGKAQELMPAEICSWGVVQERPGVKLADGNFLNRQFWELAVILPAGSTKQEQTVSSPTRRRSLPMADNGA